MSAVEKLRNGCRGMVQICEDYEAKLFAFVSRGKGLKSGSVAMK